MGLCYAVPCAGEEHLLAAAAEFRVCGVSKHRAGRAIQRQPKNDQRYLVILSDWSALHLS